MASKLDMIEKSAGPVPTGNNLTGSTDQLDGLSKNAYERRIQRLDDEKKELIRKLENSNRALQKFAHGPIVDNDVAAANESNANEIRRLQDELNSMTKRNQGKNLEIARK